MRDSAADIRAAICAILALPSGVFAEGQVTQSAICLRQASTSACKPGCDGAEPGIVTGEKEPTDETTTENLPEPNQAVRYGIG